MAVPTIIEIYPSNGQESVPVGADIKLTFSVAVDPSSVKENVVIYGRDYDLLSGPETATWLNDGDPNNPLFLRSPEFKGILEYTLSTIYVDTSTGAEVSVTDITDVTVEEAASVYQQVILTPKQTLAEQVSYKVYIVGSGEGEYSNFKGVHKRVVYEPDSSSATSTTGEVFVYGGYSGLDDTLNIKVTSSGNIGSAEYKWWYSSELESEARAGKLTSRRFRRLEDNLQIRFSGTSFVANDLYTVILYEKEFLEDSYTFSFDTATSSIKEVPSTMATTPIGTKVPTTATSGGLTVLDMDPEDGGTHQVFSDKTIIVSFSDDVDDTTVSDSSVSVYAYPVSGTFTGNQDPLDEIKELQKKLTVSGNKIIINL